MLPVGSPMYLLVPAESNERVLHPGNVIENADGRFVLEFESAVAPPAGSDADIFFERAGRFFQQGVTVVELRAPEQSPTRQQAVFQPIGQPVSAESRNSFRVCVVTLDLT